MLKRLLIYCFTAFVLGIIANVCFTVYLNRDLNYFVKAASVSTAWEKELREDHSELYIVSGGSSGRAGIDPQIILNEYNIPLVNACLGADYGLNANVAFALELARPKDTLILNIEPEIVTGPREKPLTKNGALILFRLFGFPDYQKKTFFNWDIPSRIIPFRGDSLALSNYIAKKITHPADEQYRYEKHAHVHPSGWMEVSLISLYHYLAVLTEDTMSLDAFTINESSIKQYNNIQQECRKHGIKCIAMTPRTYADASMRALRLWFALQLTRMEIPVLYDPEIGVIPNTHYFSDTANHLNKEGTVLNSRQIAESIANNRFWSEEELVSELRKRGWDDQGRRLKR